MKPIELNLANPRKRTVPDPRSIEFTENDRFVIYERTGGRYVDGSILYRVKCKRCQGEAVLDSKRVKNNKSCGCLQGWAQSKRDAFGRTKKKVSKTKDLLTRAWV